MAFVLATFDKLSASGVTGLPVLWAYESSTDNLATIGASGYFNDIAYNLSVGDYLYIKGSDGSNLYGVTAVSPNVTIAANPDVVAPDSIVNADINSAAAIDFSKLAALPSGQILVGSAGTVPTARAVTGDITLSNTGVVAIASGAIVNGDINAAAAIEFSKLATLTDSHILVGSALGVATDVAVTGDISISNTGVVAIASGSIVNSDVNASAAIDFSKLATLTSGNILVGSAGNVPTSVTMSGDATIIASGALTIANDAVTSAKTSPLMLKYASVAVSAAEFNGMYAAPKLLVAAGGADTLHVLDKCDLLMTYVSANYANGGVAHIQYDSTANGAGVIASTTLAAATFQAAASTGFVFNGGVVPQTFTTCVNKGLYLSNITGAFDTGDSTFVAHLWYKTIPTT